MRWLWRRASRPPPAVAVTGRAEDCSAVGWAVAHQIAPRFRTAILDLPASTTSPTRAPQRVVRDVPCTPLCPPSTSRTEARCAQCACLAIHGKRTQGSSLKHRGRPPLARAARFLRPRRKATAHIRVGTDVPCSHFSPPAPSSSQRASKSVNVAIAEPSRCKLGRSLQAGRRSPEQRGHRLFDSQMTTLIGRRWATTPVGGGRPEGRRTGYLPEHDHAPGSHHDPLPSWSSAILGAAVPADGGNPEGRYAASQPLSAPNFEALPTAGRDACRYKGGREQRQRQ